MVTQLSGPNMKEVLLVGPVHPMMHYVASVLFFPIHPLFLGFIIAVIEEYNDLSLYQFHLSARVFLEDNHKNKHNLQKIKFGKVLVHLYFI